LLLVAVSGQAEIVKPFFADRLNPKPRAFKVQCPRQPTEWLQLVCNAKLILVMIGAKPRSAFEPGPGDPAMSMATKRAVAVGLQCQVDPRHRQSKTPSASEQGPSDPAVHASS